MKTPEEIKYGLECCPKYEACTLEVCECPYFMNLMCSLDLMHDALAYINELEERISLMKIQMRGDCGTCKHRSDDNGPCNACVLDENRPAWEYEGLPEIRR